MDNYERENETDMEIYNEMSDDEEIENIDQLIPADVAIQPMLLFKLDFQNNDVSIKDNVRAMIEKYNSRISEATERYKMLEFNDEFADIYNQTKYKERSTALYHAVTKNEHKIT